MSEHDHEPDDVDWENEPMVTLGDGLAAIAAAREEVSRETAAQLLRTDQRTPPHSMEAERAVLGSLLLDGGCFDAVADELLEAGHFYRKHHGTIFGAIVGLHARAEPIDTLTVTEELARHQKLDAVGGAAAISQLEAALPSSVNAATYARIVREKATLRWLIGQAQTVVELCYSGSLPVEEIVEHAQRIFVDAAVKRRHAVADRAATVRKVMDSIGTTQRRGIPTGWADLDHGVLRRGLRAGNLIYIGARPAMGKTALGLQLAAHVADRHASAAFFSLEMNEEELIEREIAMRSGVGSGGWADAMRLGRSGMQAAAGHVSERMLHHVHCPGWKVTQIVAEARRLVARCGVALIVIDYLGLVGGTGNYAGNRTQEVGEVSRALKALAGELQIPIVCLAQLNRAVEGRADKRPGLSDLRDTGEIEQDGDVIMFLHRPEYYLKENTPEDLKHIAEVIVAKQRNGPTDVCRLWFEGETTSFQSVQEDHR